jgi:hypothetical protein
LPITRADLNERAMQRLIERMRTRRMFSMTGAGLSAWAGYPLWPMLLHRLEQRVQEVRDGEVDVALIRRRWGHSPLEFAGKLGRELGDDFLRFLRAQFGVGGGTGLAPVLFQFASLPFQHHMTLNIDDSLERSHPNGLQSCGSVTSADRSALVEFLERCEDPTYGKKAVHCHGVHTDPLDGLILTEPGYAAFYQDSDLFKQIYWALLSTRSFLFAGFGFTDKDFLDALQAWKRDTRARENQLVHFAIYGLSAGEDDEAVRARLAGTYRIDSIFYEVLPDHGHQGFATIIANLTQALGTIDLPPQVPIALAVAAAANLNVEDEARIEELTNTMLGRAEGGLPDA